MGGKPRKDSVKIEEVENPDGLIMVDEMDISENGKSKWAGIICPFVGEALEVRIHRKVHALDITAMNITNISFSRLGRGRAAMTPGGVKQLIIKVKYRDRS